MNEAPLERLERRVLVLAPVGKDSSLVQTMLQRDAVECFACADVDSLACELARGAAALLVAEEALPSNGQLAALVQAQPPWSDLPILILTRPGADSAAAARAMRTLGNVTLLERPVRIAALSSAVRSALRARERQYQTRAHVAEREEADRRKDEFLATLAHELRNPLAPIRNSLDLLRLSGATPSPQVWDMMHRQVYQMVRLVDDLMEVSRITRGKIELRKDAVALADVIAAAIETSRPLIEAARHELAVVLPPEPLVVHADAMRLAQVFANLLNNAVKYTDPGGRITLAARRDNGAVTVSISDTGIGISADALPRVFDMFVQADARDSRAQTGLGIGLTLVRSLVEMHGGSVSAHSAGAGRGSEFVVRLPLGAAGRDAQRTRPAREPGKVAGVPRVMVVDDNADAAESLAALLHILGADVHVTYDGPGALEALPSFRPAAIFLDLGLPGMDGYEIARNIRARPEAGKTLLVALTGWGQERDRRRTEAAGFDRHLVKPADLSALQAVLASLDAESTTN